MSWLGIKLFFGRLGLYLYFGLRLYYLWSKVYRFVWERQYQRTLEISVYDSYRALTRVTEKLTWTADGPKQLGDVISSPEWVEYCIRTGTKNVGDCDEFAIYNVAALNRSLDTKAFTGDDQLVEAFLMSVMWVDADGKYGGHNVALLVRDFEYHDMYSYIDYDNPGKDRMTVREVAQDIVDRYVPGGTLMMLAVADQDLRLAQLSE
jgi:hypothetical protein